jgi:hypothetical protein
MSLSGFNQTMFMLSNASRNYSQLEDYFDSLTL